MTHEDKIERFKKSLRSVKAQKPIDELAYLLLCKEAVDVVKTEWNDREIIASHLAGIWLRHDAELSEVARTIGGAFADLEVPDTHIDTSHGLTVRQLWEQLDRNIDKAISSHEHLSTL